jgi:hypothetical protein
VEDLLIEVTSDQLRNELRRREELARAGRCPYCTRSLAEHRCAWRGREGEYHQAAQGQLFSAPTPYEYRR